MEYKETTNFCDGEVMADDYDDGDGRGVNYSITTQEIIEALLN